MPHNRLQNSVGKILNIINAFVPFSNVAQNISETLDLFLTSVPLKNTQNKSPLESCFVAITICAMWRKVIVYQGVGSHLTSI